ncbi:aspartyl-phosphate phosphatase Spo0E family protein [Alkalicoccus chagannorensis]|uniref:aspartyl-phosphate phosphatase Spo0E family protein n=1 Tax=Alkalicoccus chagannorensis TaxID=427072 RepID=UPI0003F7F890|nr:aspartyl-phosphate phosphatase Spo0E family protein [Alkalicoccus chagannorensis]
MRRTNHISEELESKRRKMMEYAQKYGFTSNEAVRLSQELDQLMNVDYRRKRKQSGKVMS